jgi:RimJ/RimL family protein N-acetyltransferase
MGGNQRFRNIPMNSDAVANFTSIERLRDKRSLTIRAIRPDDRGLLIDALRNVGPESRYLRFFSSKAKFTDHELTNATAVDFVNVVALVALLEENGQDRIVGGGRYLRIGAAGGGGRAEVAFLVDDDHQGLGIGSRLFRHLVAIARASGIARLEADVLPANEAMLRLFARSGLPITRTVTADAVHLTIDVTAQGDAGG